MVWKLLSGIAAVCLAAAAYFAFISQNDIKAEREAKATADQNFATVGKQREAANESLKNKQTQLATLTKDLEKTKTDVAAATAEAAEKAAALELAKKNLEQTAQQLGAVETKIKEAGDIEKLLAQVNALKKDKEAAEGEVATQATAVAQAQEKVAQLTKEIERNRDIDARARKGELDPTFTAKITQAFSDWGFAVLNKGNSGGVVANAELDVKRGGDVVARLKVRNVEQAISVVDIVPGSLKEGNTLRAGDTVVPAPKKEVPPPPPTPTADPTKPAAPPTGTPPPVNADPFAPAPGAAPAPMAPAAADPFATPAPAAPKPGAPAADPFGAPPAAPAPAPAPAAPPAAGGAGTKESPSKADPFAKP